mmetsp:Transcript_7999/g.13057  ORF Transcript_7999/g.13057 Transcript_7999/m.13057 type:complete len:204 (-) Transcript_7999:962-1573(-)
MSWTSVQDWRRWWVCRDLQGHTLQQGGMPSDQVCPGIPLGHAARRLLPRVHAREVLRSCQRARRRWQQAVLRGPQLLPHHGGVAVLDRGREDFPVPRVAAGRGARLPTLPGARQDRRQLRPLRGDGVLERLQVRRGLPRRGLQLRGLCRGGGDHDLRCPALDAPGRMRVPERPMPVAREMPPEMRGLCRAAVPCGSRVPGRPV